MSERATDAIDHRLITEFKAGSMEAMEKIVERHEERIFAFGLKMCGHLQDAEDIAQAICFLISDAAKFICGAELTVDGGWTSF